MAEKNERCPSCGGNDQDTPCAYPSKGMPGCPRDARLKANPPEPHITNNQKDALLKIVLDAWRVEGICDELTARRIWMMYNTGIDNLNASIYLEKLTQPTEAP